MTLFSHSNDTHAATAFCAMQGNVDDILLAGQVGGGITSLSFEKIPNLMFALSSVCFLLSVKATD